MNEPNDSSGDDERRLQALFDATAAEPSQPQLDRLARGAATIPEQQPRLSWRWLRIGAPLALAAALALGVWLSREQGPQGLPAGPIAEGSGQTVPTAPPSTTEPSDEELDELALDFDLDDGDDDMIALDDPLAALDFGSAAMFSPGSLLDLLDPPDEDAITDAAAESFNALLEDG